METTTSTTETQTAEVIKATIEEMVRLIGFGDFSLNFDQEGKKIIIFINEGEWFSNWVPRLVADFNSLSRVLSRKYNLDNVFVDINNYRKERENIILEIAKAAARKALISKEKVQLPAMNAYERRLIHTELSTRPDVATESEGEGEARHVIVKPL